MDHIDNNSYKGNLVQLIEIDIRGEIDLEEGVFLNLNNKFKTFAQQQAGASYRTYYLARINLNGKGRDSNKIYVEGLYSL